MLLKYPVIKSLNEYTVVSADLLKDLLDNSGYGWSRPN